MSRIVHRPVPRLVASSALLVSLLSSMAVTAHAQAAPGTCADGAPLDAPFASPSWNGWGAGPAQRRFQTAAMAGMDAGGVANLELRWAFGFPGVPTAYGQPTVVGGRVFVGSADGTVYSLDAASGCLHWTFKADQAVRTAMSVGPAGDGWAVYFGDLVGNAYALDADTGRLLWKTHIDEHPGVRITGAPTLADGRLYVPASSTEEALAADGNYACCTFRGSVSALDAETGEVVWKSYTIPEAPTRTRTNPQGVQNRGPSGAAVWSSPTVDLEAGRVYVTTGDSYSDPPAPTSDAFVAFDLDTGALVWFSQMTEGDAFTMDCDLPAEARTNCPDAEGPDFDFGSSPVLVELGGGQRALVAGQKSGLVHAVDPDNDGKILWQARIGKGGRLGGIQWGLAADDRYVYAAVSDVAPTGPAPGTDGQPTFIGVNLSLDPNAGGGLFALDPATGEIVWQTPHPGCNGESDCSPAQSAAVSAIPGVVFSPGLDGHLRAYASDDGRILWDVTTKRAYETVNGVEARGGSIDGTGAVVAGGIVYVNSGYLFLGQTPGNVLLAFSAGGR